MNARIIKETRSVLPVLGVTMLASAAPRLIWSRETAGGAGLAFFTLCCLLIGAACFGNEFQWRTMPLLLAQPVPRRRIWNEKMLVLAGALGLGLVFFLLCVPAGGKGQLFLPGAGAVLRVLRGALHGAPAAKHVSRRGADLWPSVWNRRVAEAVDVDIFALRSRRGPGAGGLDRTTRLRVRNRHGGNLLRRVLLAGIPGLPEIGGCSRAIKGNEAAAATRDRRWRGRSTGSSRVIAARGRACCARNCRSRRRRLCWRS